MNIREKYKNALPELPEGITGAEAEGRREIILSLSVSDKEITSSKSSDVTTVSVRVQTGSGVGFAFSQDLEEPAEAVFIRAYEGGLAAGKETAVFGAEEKLSAVCPGELMSVQKAVETAAQMERWAHEAAPDKVAQAEITVSSYKTENWTVNTNGLDTEASSVWYDCTAEIVLCIEGKTYNCSWCTSCRSPEAILASKDDMQRSIKRNIVSKGEPVNFESGSYRAILSRESLCQMLVCMWQPFSGVRQMEGKSCVSNLMGQAVASPVLNITDASVLPGCGYSRRLDTEGATGNTTEIIKNGVLTGRMHNRKSASFFNEQPTGNAARAEGFFSGLPTGNTASPNVTYIVPGKMREDNMLEMLGDGVWITETHDPFHSIEPTSGDFAIPCNGVLIKNGRPAGILNSLTITGNLLELWKNIEAVGDTNLFWRFYTGLYYLGGADILVSKLQIN